MHGIGIQGRRWFPQPDHRFHPDYRHGHCLQANGSVPIVQKILADPDSIGRWVVAEFIGYDAVWRSFNGRDFSWHRNGKAQIAWYKAKERSHRRCFSYSTGPWSWLGRSLLVRCGKHWRDPGLGFPIQ